MNNTNKCIAACVSLAALIACTPQQDSNSDDRIDLIIEGDHVVTMDSDNKIIEGGAVAVDDGVILAVGPASDIHANYSAVETLPGGNRVVMPGLVNGHGHAAMTLLRGVADDLALMESSLPRSSSSMRSLYASVPNSHAGK